MAVTIRHLGVAVAATAIIGSVLLLPGPASANGEGFRLGPASGIPVAATSVGLTDPASPGTLQTTISIMGLTVTGLTGLGVMDRCAIAAGFGVHISIVEAISSRPRRAVTEDSKF